MAVDKVSIGAIIATVVIIGGVFGYATWQQEKRNNTPAHELCITHEGIGMHIHPTLSIVIEGEKLTIPANIGISSTCMRAVHTHDESGKIHLEYPSQHDFLLQDFFLNWQQPFSKDQIMDKTVDGEHTLTMIVDGSPSDQYEKLVLKDNQQIEIRYERKK